MKSLLTAMRWISNPVGNDPITALVERENTFHMQNKQKKRHNISSATKLSLLIMLDNSNDVRVAYLSSYSINWRTTSKEEVFMNMQGMYDLFS